MTNGINEPSGLKRDYTIEGRLPDAENDFGDGFLGGDGFGLMDGEFDDLPQVPGLDLDGEGLDGIKDAEAATSKAPDNQGMCVLYFQYYILWKLFYGNCIL